MAVSLDELESPSVDLMFRMLVRFRLTLDLFIALHPGNIKGHIRTGIDRLMTVHTHGDFLLVLPHWETRLLAP